MSRIDLSTTRELFLRLGATPRSRSARADKLFRRLRAEDSEALVDALLKPAGKISVPRKLPAASPKK
ncbi:MAG: hypothetical protein ABL957_10000 [Parvularculaceae bacterium]